MTAPALRIPNQTGTNSAQFGSSTLTDSPGHPAGDEAVGDPVGLRVTSP